MKNSAVFGKFTVSMEKFLKWLTGQMSENLNFVEVRLLFEVDGAYHLEKYNIIEYIFCFGLMLVYLQQNLFQVSLDLPLS